MKKQNPQRELTPPPLGPISNESTNGAWSSTSATDPRYSHVYRFFDHCWVASDPSGGVPKGLGVIIPTSQMGKLSDCKPCKGLTGTVLLA